MLTPNPRNKAKLKEKYYLRKKKKENMMRYDSRSDLKIKCNRFFPAQLRS